MPQIITKADGSREPFDQRKLASSLMRAGAPQDIAEMIAEDVSREISEGMTTHDIYSRAFNRLRKERRSNAARYSLKRAVLELGPSGFPFEAFLSKIFESQGYAVALDQHIKGACVEHEIDVVLTTEKEIVFVEAKFHNTVGFKTDLQVALYVQARLEDIVAGMRDSHSKKARGMLITNTKFTSLATQYASCQGLELLGWDYPEKHNLFALIEGSRLYPITALTSLTREEKNTLLSAQVVLCRDVQDGGEMLENLAIPPDRMAQIRQEAGELCLPAHALQ